MNKRLVKKNGNKIFFKYNLDSNEWLLFGEIENGEIKTIKLNIETYHQKGFYQDTFETQIPNPPIEFYVQLGYLLKNEI